MSILTEVNMIVDPDIREFTERALTLAPDYFWTDEELILHTKKCVWLCREYANMDKLSSEHTDMLISAAILHDTFRYGLEGREKYKGDRLSTDALHVVYPMAAFERFFDEYESAHAICHIIAQHNGRFTRLRLKENHLGRLLHVADYTVSLEDE